MLSWLTPNLQLTSVLELDSERLRYLGLEGLLLDLDSTLKAHGAHEFQPEVIAWVERLRSRGIRLCILSNGRPRRVGLLAQRLAIPFVAKAFKPLPFGCRAGLA